MRNIFGRWNEAPSRKLGKCEQGCERQAPLYARVGGRELGWTFARPSTTTGRETGTAESPRRPAVKCILTMAVLDQTRRHFCEFIFNFLLQSNQSVPVLAGGASGCHS